MARFAGKSVLLTGATAGIGLATAEQLAAEGARLTLVARGRERGEALASRLGPDVEFLALDVIEEGAAALAVERATGHFGALDVLVNNVGLDHSGDLLAVSDHEVRDVLETNFLAPLRLLIVAAAAMADRGGAIVNVSSRLAAVGVPGMIVYGASKGALSSLTRGAAVELAPRGIRVNAVAPGLTETPLMRAWLDGHEEPESAARSALAGIPQGRFGTPEEVASAIAFLASDEATHITGAVLAVDGGYTAA